MNQLTITGNLAADPVARLTPSGQEVTSARLASNRFYTNSKGEKVKDTTWFNLTFWGKLGEIASKYTHKGSKILVTGRLNHDENGNPRTYEVEGKARASFDLTVETIELLDPKPEGGNGSQEEAMSVGEEIPFAS